jgi:hypothetical protein
MRNLKIIYIGIKFKAICDESAASGSSERSDVLARLGGLMFDRSHDVILFLMKAR